MGVVRASGDVAARIINVPLRKSGMFHALHWEFRGVARKREICCTIPKIASP